MGLRSPVLIEEYMVSLFFIAGNIYGDCQVKFFQTTSGQEISPYLSCSFDDFTR